MIIGRSSVALKKQKFSIAYRLFLSAAGGLLTYGILWSAYNNALIQVAFMASSFGVLMVAIAMKN